MAFAQIPYRVETNMLLGIGLRVALIFTGALLLIITLFSLARRKMTDSFVLTWVLISVVFVLAGAFLHPMELNRYISATGMLLAGAIGFCAVFGVYFISVRVSELARRNLELAMQVTLLRKEIEEEKKRLESLLSPADGKELLDEEENPGGD